MSGELKENIKDKVFLVTGGAAGVGAGLVRALLAKDAAHVAIIDISEREGASLEAELKTKFGALKAKFVKCDISKEEQLQAAYQQVLDKYRRVDVVVNNAGVLNEDADYRAMIDVNFTATVSSTLRALDVMAVKRGGRGGSIVNISSLLALENDRHLPVYSATKTAVLKFSSTIGTEEHYSATQVRVITVCLGPTDTAILFRRTISGHIDKETQLASRVADRQRVESAVLGIIDVINSAASGTTWMVANNKPAVDITTKVKAGFDALATSICT